MIKAHNTFTLLTVNLKNNAYPVLIGEGLLDSEKHLKPYIKGSQVFIVTDTVVAKCYLDNILETLQQVESVKQVDFLTIEAGEKNKTLNNAELIWTTLIKKNHHRDTTVIALGGGVIGDLAGFCAACYLRGVNFIQVPTTLLAQVDAAVGGKTAINHPLGKNLIGAFYQPNAVIMDIAVLTTLPNRIFIAGLAEVVKMAIALDENFFYWLEENIHKILVFEPKYLQLMIENAVRIKADIVVKDEKEVDLRGLLNFGHTLGHALENVLGYENILHGEAVSIGMIAAAKLSSQLQLIDESVVSRLESLLMSMGLPTAIPEGQSAITAENLLRVINLDKKNRSYEYRWVLLSGFGKSHIQEIPKQAIEKLLSHLEVK